MTVTGATEKAVNYDLSKFRSVGEAVQQVVTTTAPGSSGVPDWKQHAETLRLERTAQKVLRTNLHPKSVYTFVFQDV
jgi:hypothetical protein